NGTAACSVDCKLPICGDGVQQPGEDCDLGDDNSDTGACTSQCKAATCGDTFVHAGDEECDDGNQSPGDGCSNSCDHEYLMFATAATHPADFGGIAEADALCAAAAAGKL